MIRISRHLSGILNPVLDFIYPPVCPICDGVMTAYAPICSGCQLSIKNRMHLKHHFSQDFHHLKKPLFLDDVITFWEYFPGIEKAIHMIKYKDRKKLGALLGQWAAQTLRAAQMEQFNLIVPVPLHPRRLRERGFNQSHILAREISLHTDIPVALRILKRSKYTETQTLLSAEKRQENVYHAFDVRSPAKFENQHILLVDDVITSGATVNSCAAACKAAGAISVIGLGMARPELL